MSADPGRCDPGEEIHIAGALVHARLPQLPSVCDALVAFSCAELVQATPDGRLVVVLEGSSARDIVSALDEIRNVPGVLNVALVYQHAESATSMLETLEEIDR
ncbi:chaperone NapD [Aquabacterium sp. A7-Y]|uniref:chaperone NapD n=1 Tax=Aquabacterium sp. A7-Y TaxID=1349605 RepID=UPI00223D6D66|nr:chaperone NapD [Aquabacterium sp. A7-Y]MCW7537902.1 chaperone NapD [Aquabacterium sp. A7-Y]